MIKKDGDGIPSVTLVFHLNIYDYALNRYANIDVQYTEAFFQNLWEAFSKYFDDYKPENLLDCIKLAKENVWYIRKKTNGIFTNYYPCRHTPFTDFDYKNSVIDIIEL